MWYSTLEEDLDKLRDVEDSSESGEETAEHLRGVETQAILEEMLELSRINQKLLRRSEGRREREQAEVAERLAGLQIRLEETSVRLQEGGLGHGRRSRRDDRGYGVMVDELVRMPGMENGSYVPVQMALALLRNRYPWIYDAGLETIGVLRARGRVGDKQAALAQFDRILGITFEHPAFRETAGDDGETRYVLYKLREMLEAISGI